MFDTNTTSTSKIKTLPAVKKEIEKLLLIVTPEEPVEHRGVTRHLDNHLPSPFPFRHLQPLRRPQRDPMLILQLHQHRLALPAKLLPRFVRHPVNNPKQILLLEPFRVLLQFVRLPLFSLQI